MTNNITSQKIFNTNPDYINVNRDITIHDCLGKRFIGAGVSDDNITINGTPGNALGAYLNGAKITVNGNAQDAVGDTMNDGKIIVNGNAGDALGYAMRGGKIFIKGNCGYRTGIHMKEYNEKRPCIVIGGSCGSFLGEYMAGGVIIILGLGSDEIPVGNFTGTGMHGGKIFIRSDGLPRNLPAQVLARQANKKDLENIHAYIKEFSIIFDIKTHEIYNKSFYILQPNEKNPYSLLYTEN